MRARTTPRALSRPTRPTRPRIALVACTLAALSTAPAVARADEPSPLSPVEVRALHDLTEAPRGFFRVNGSLELGDGLRFNNPYRLSSELGSTAESVSRTAAYVDLAASITYGPARGLAHGFGIHLCTALEGVPQQVVTPSYVAEYRTRDARWLFGGRFATPIIVTPDATMGFELAATAAYFFTGKIGVGAELVGDVFYGAATPTTAISAYPILSAQLGVVFSQELLP